MRFRAALFPLVLLAAACGGDRTGAGGADGGTMVISTGGDADGFLPPVTENVTSAQVETQLFERLAEPGPTVSTFGDVGFTPELASGWTWSRDSLSIAFHLDPKARWHDGVPVTSKDVRFTYEITRDSATGSVNRPLIANIDSVTTPDPLTAVFWFSRRYPEQFFDATYQMRIVPEHLLASIPRKDIATSPFRRQPVGSGPFKFVKWEPRQSIVLEADRGYHLGRPRLDRLIWSVAPDPNTAALRLLSGEADFLEFLRPPDFAEVAKHPNLRTLPVPLFGLGFVLFNERDPRDPKAASPIFGDREVRRALSMAIDRQAIVQSVFDTLATVGHGPVTRNYATYDSTIALLPYAPDSAAKLLDALGWKPGKDGIRVKNGRPLAFSMLVPASSSVRRNMAVLLQDAFKKVGAKVDIESVDFATLGGRMEKRDFETTILNLGLDPSPGNLRQSWGSAHGVPSEGNFGSYVSPAFTAQVDSGLRELDQAKARRHFSRAYAIAIADAPAIWLYEPHNVAGMDKRIHAVGVVPGAWWANLRLWYIPAAERNARDRAAALPTPPAPPPAPATVKP